MARRRFKPDGHDADLTAEPPKGDEGVFVGPPTTPHSGPEFDLNLASSVPPAMPPVALPAPAAETLLVPLEDRLRRVEAALTRLAELQVPDRGGDPQRGQVTTRPGGPSMISRAAALLPELNLHDRPPGGAATPTTNSRLSLFRDAVAELQAIFYMYVDPRYRLSWFGRGTPVLILALFLLSSFVAGVILDPIVKLALSYALFKVLSAEARRYRETAPDLPAHLRL